LSLQEKKFSLEARFDEREAVALTTSIEQEQSSEINEVAVFQNGIAITVCVLFSLAEGVVQDDFSWTNGVWL
jgi:hypothetical protein